MLILWYKLDQRFAQEPNKKEPLLIIDPRFSLPDIL